MRPSFGIAIAALVTACTNEFDTLAVGGGAGGETTGSSSAGPSSGSASSPTGGEGSSGGAGGLGASLGDAGAPGGASSGSGAGGAPAAGGAAGTGGTPVAAPACQDQYGSAAVMMCKESETECAFNFVNSSQSCGAVCQAFGGECVEMYSDGADNCSFDPQAPQGCGYVGWSDSVCICSRGCGGGAPCTAPAVCTNGACS